MGTGNYSLPAISKAGKQIDQPFAHTKDSYEIFVSTSSPAGSGMSLHHEKATLTPT